MMSSVRKRLTPTKAASGRAGQLGDRAIGADAGDLVLGRMHRPDVAGETHLEALLDDGSSLDAAEHGDGAGAEKAFKTVHDHPPLS